MLQPGGARSARELQSIDAVLRQATHVVTAALCLATSAWGQDEPESQTQTLTVLVIVESGEPGLENAAPSAEGAPLKVLQGTAVRIRGAVASKLAGQPLKVTVTPPQGPQQPDPKQAPTEMPEGGDSELYMTGSPRIEPPATLSVTAAADGTFSTLYRTLVSGEHEVLVRDRTGQHSGESTFEVESASEYGDNLREALKREAEKLLENSRKLVKAIEPRLNEIPASPARDEAIQKLETAIEAIDRLHAEGEPEWSKGLHYLPKLQKMGPKINQATTPLVGQLTAWKEQAARANRKAAEPLAELTRGNVMCDQLDVVVNGLKLIDFYLGLFTRPEQFLIDWGKENIPPRLVQMLPGVKPTNAATDALESSWKGLLGAYASGRQGNVGAGTSAFALKSVNDLSTFMASRVFERYCQVFKGPVSGSMAAVFTRQGRAWWTYRVDIVGELVLRYPKDAKGEHVALTGEFMGNATRFKSSDQALLVLHPELVGTVYREIHRLEPLTMSNFPIFYSSPTAAPSLPNPIMSSVDKGGPAVKNALTPAFFRVPVRGDLRGDIIRVELQQAATDFEGNATKVRQLILPVLSMRLQVVDYALPYKGARFILYRAMNDGPAEFKVNRAGNMMFIEHRFTRERKANETEGTYALSVKACNPGC